MSPSSHCSISSRGAWPPARLLSAGSEPPYREDMTPGATPDTRRRLDPALPIEDTIGALAELDIGVAAYGVLSRGLLTGARTNAPGDFRAFCTETGHGFVDQTEADGVYTIVLRRKG